MNAIIKPTWDIDLTGRKMWYPPWPVDEKGNYRQPSEKEREDIYCISGQAVKETLIYFTERADIELSKSGGSVWAIECLLSLLNEHVQDERYEVSRGDLMNEDRWYNNEYYFYFIMFTKKVLGRYDFHFGENSNRQLSIHHKIFEKGLMEYIPWGMDEFGEEVHDVTINNNLVIVLYLEKILKIDISDFIVFINRSLLDGYTIDRDLYNKEEVWCSVEFIEYGFEFLKVIANSNMVLKAGSCQSILSGIRLARMIMTLAGRFLPIALQTAKSKANDIHTYDVRNTINTLELLVRVKQGFDLTKYSKYSLSSMWNDSMVHLGAVMGAVILMMKLNDEPFYSITYLSKNEYIGFTIKYTWIPALGFVNRIVSSFLVALFLCVLWRLLDWTILLNEYILGVVVILVLLLYNYLMDKNNRTLSEFENYKSGSLKQLDELEKTTADLVLQRNLLEQRVKERTSELADANEKLKTLDHAKTEFFANVSHELRTPLTLILAPLESLLQGQYKKEPDRDFFENLYRQGNRLLRLINNLLDFAKIEAGRMVLEKKPADVDKLLRQYVSSISSAAEARGLKITYENEAGNVIASLDRGLFENALYNLLSNAVKFTSPGGSIGVVLKTDNGQMQVTVTDTGIGIPEDKQDLIFERFAQADGSSTRKYEGTGIGLSLTKEIALMHGGEVTVQSAPGAGSDFTLSLPLIPALPEGGETRSEDDADLVNPSRWQDIAVAPARETAGESREAPLVTEKEYRVLIAEDNGDMLAFLRETLGASYEVQTATNGREALDILRSQEVLPDIILSDVMMPELDGLELTDAVRSDKRFEGIPILLLTARADMDDRLAGFASGATDYISKPFNARELMARIEAQVQLKALRDRLIKSNEKLYGQLREKAGGPSSPGVSDAAEEKVRKVLEFINENYDTDLSREGLASAVDLSPDHLSRAFNAVTGKRLDNYITELRIEEAKKRLVNTADTIITIAFGVGFDNLRTFNKAFSRHTGMTPTLWRQGKDRN